MKENTLTKEVVTTLTEVADRLEMDYGKEDGLATECRYLIRRMLKVTPKKRRTIAK